MGRPEGEGCSFFNSREIPTARVVGHFFGVTESCVQCSGAAGGKERSGFAGSKQVLNMMAVYQKSESHGAQIECCVLVRESLSSS